MTRLGLAARRHRRSVATLSIVLGILVTANVLREYGPAGTGLVLGPVVAVALIAFARRSGLSWQDLGLARRSLAKGAGYAAVGVWFVAAAYTCITLLPVTSAAVHDARYHMPTGRALVTALVIIPVGTVLLEEIAFRGVLLGLVSRRRGMAWGLGFSSALFGAWHVLPSLGLAQANPAVRTLAGTGVGAQLAVVLAVVAVTTLAGLLLGELRRRSGSLLAAAGLHWAVNGLGVLVAAGIFAVGTS